MNEERGTLNTEHGTRNGEYGTQNAERRTMKLSGRAETRNSEPPRRETVLDEEPADNASFRARVVFRFIHFIV